MDDTSECLYYELTFAENKNFHLHRCCVFTPSERSGATLQKTGEKLSVITEQIVLKYTEIAEGLFFPVDIARGFGHSFSFDNEGKPLPEFYSTHFVIDKIKINEQAKEASCFIIPENSIVYRMDLLETVDTLQGISFVPISIWGKGNKPTQTFTNNKDYESFIESLRQSENDLQVSNLSWARLMMMLFGGLLVVVALIMKYNRKKQFF